MLNEKSAILTWGGRGGRGGGGGEEGEVCGGSVPKKTDNPHPSPLQDLQGKQIRLKQLKEIPATRIGLQTVGGSKNNHKNNKCKQISAFT